MELAKRRFKVNTYQARYPYALRIQPQNHGENPELIHPPEERNYIEIRALKWVFAIFINDGLWVIIYKHRALLNRDTIPLDMGHI